MYENGLLGILSAEALVNTLWLLNKAHFGMRGCEERSLHVRILNEISSSWAKRG